MTGHVVIDATTTLGLFLRLPCSARVENRMQVWHASQARIVVPTLWEYECVSAFRRAAGMGIIDSALTERMVRALADLRFEQVPPSPALDLAALAWAQRLGQSTVCDAHYVALAESLSAEFWTVNTALCHDLLELGVGWVRFL
jgi:predicted nucleic acid-binding protein